MTARTWQEAAKQASLGDDEKLWNICLELARKGSYNNDPSLSNQQMCERAIKSFSAEQRRHFGIIIGRP